MTDLRYPTLAPCPFCNADTICEGAWARHPEADCLLSGEILFAWTVLANVRRWNQRAVLVTSAARDVLAERQRQINAEGWTPEHDDTHTRGEMAMAAGCYLLQVQLGSELDTVWPWEKHWFKPTDHRRDLVKTGALVLAEIERLDRRPIAEGQ